VILVPVDDIAFPMRAARSARHFLFRNLVLDAVTNSARHFIGAVLRAPNFREVVSRFTRAALIGGIRVLRAHAVAVGRHCRAIAALGRARLGFPGATALAAAYAILH